MNTDQALNAVFSIFNKYNGVVNPTVNAKIDPFRIDDLEYMFRGKGRQKVAFGLHYIEKPNVLCFQFDWVFLPQDKIEAAIVSGLYFIELVDWGRVFVQGSFCSNDQYVDTLRRACDLLSIGTIYKKLEEE